MAAIRRPRSRASREVWAAPDGRPPRRRRRDAGRGRLAARPARKPGAPGSTRSARIRDCQPARSHRAGIRGRVGGPQFRAPSRRVRGGDARAAAAEREALAAAAGLQQSESFNRSILDNSGDCIQVLEPDGRIVLVNRPGLALMEIDDVNALVGAAVDDALERRRRARSAGHRRRDRQGRRTVPRVSPDRQGHAEVVGRHRHAHSRRRRGRGAEAGDRVA